jgi:hypothetical protein
MLVNLLKFVAVLFFNRKMATFADDLLNLRSHVVDYTEDRGQQIKQDFWRETERIATSIVGLLVVFSMFIFTGLLGLMWLFSILWENPHRTLILGIAMLIPALLGGIAFWMVRNLWNRKPLFGDSLAMLSSDWQLFRNEMASTEQAQKEATPPPESDAGRSPT